MDSLIDISSGPAVSGGEETIRQNLTDRRNDTDALLAGECVAQAARLADEIVSALRRGNKVIFFGNGGSSMDSGHLAAELLGRFHYDRPSLPAVSLPDSTAAMTAIGNDYSYDEVFARPLRGIARPGDVAVGLSTSGNSGNVVNALQAAKDLGVLPVAMTGENSGKVDAIAEFTIHVPSTSTPRIQEMCMHLGHTVCELVERTIFPRETLGA